MAKWECVKIWFWETDRIKRLFAAPSGKIDLSWLVQLDPKMKHSGWQHHTDTYEFKSAGAAQAYWAVVDWLGSNGWEPFTVEEGDVIWFRRSS